MGSQPGEGPRKSSPNVTGVDAGNGASLCVDVAVGVGVAVGTGVAVEVKVGVGVGGKGVDFGGT